MMVKLAELIEAVDEDKIVTFPLIMNGVAYAQNKKNNKPCRVSIAIPEPVGTEDLGELDNWWFKVVAIKGEHFNEVFKKLKEKEKDVQKSK